MKQPVRITVVVETAKRLSPNPYLLVGRCLATSAQQPTEEVGSEVRYYYDICKAGSTSVKPGLSERSRSEIMLTAEAIAGTLKKPVLPQQVFVTQEAFVDLEPVFRTQGVLFEVEP